MPAKTTFNKLAIQKKITQLFFKKGYYATSMQDIVDVSNLNRSSIYNTFGNKLELFLTCFEKCEANYRKEIQNIIVSTTNPLKTLTSVLELSIEKNSNGYLVPNYFTELKNQEKSILKMVFNHQEYLEDLFINIVKRGQNLGSINNSKSPKQYAIYLLNIYQGLQVLKFSKNDKNDLKNSISISLLLLE